MDKKEQFKKRDEVERKIKKINKLVDDVEEIKNKYPKLKSIVGNNCGSIINGYREGDISFKDAKIRLQNIVDTRINNRISKIKMILDL